MEKQRKNIDDLFKEELGSYAETPPPQAWDALEKRLGKIPPPGTGPGLLGHLSRYLLVACAAAVLGVSVSRKAAFNDNSGFINSHTEQQAANTKGATNTIATPNDNNRPAQQASGNATSAATGGTTPGHQTNSNAYNTTDSANNTIAAKAAATGGNIAANTNGLPQNSNDNGHATQNTGATGNHKETGNSVLAVNSNKYNTTKSPNTTTRHRSHANNENAAAVAKTTTSRHNRPKTNKAQNGVKDNSKTGRQNNSIPTGQQDDNESAKPVTNDYNSSAIAKNNDLKNIPSVGVNDAPAALPGTFKDTKTEAAKLADADPLMKKHTDDLLPATKLSHIEAGIKAGYEGGINSSAGKKIVVSPYLQYSMSSKISVMVQPAVKYSHANTTPLNGKLSYYKENSDSAASVTGKTPVYETTNDLIGYVNQVTFTQTHDSITKSYTTGGAYMEFELPVLLKYAVSKSCSFYGGFTVAYSSYIGISEHTYTNSGLKMAADTTEFVLLNHTLVLPPVSSEIIYKGNEISTYKGPLYATPAGGNFRMGYMLGFNYVYSKKWLFDVLMQQSAARASSVGGYNTNAPFSVPYFRITLGYKLF